MQPDFTEVCVLKAMVGKEVWVLHAFRGKTASQKSSHATQFLSAHVQQPSQS